MNEKMGRMAATRTMIGDSDRICDKNDRINERDANRMIISTEVGEDAAQMRIRDEETSNSNSSESENFFVKYRGKTYEISDFFKKHPGGRQTLKSYRGLPLDKVLNEVPHSDAAFHMFEEFVVDKRREYDDIENLVDWTAPLLSQVGSLADRYWEWVNLPVNRSIRLFKSNFLEYLTITPWYLVPTVWIPISMYFLYSGCTANYSKNVQLYSIPEIVLSVLAGLLLWSIMEYVLHRNLFHLKPPAESKRLITLHFLVHGLHHKAPFDDQRLLFPPMAAILIATIFYKMYKAVLPDVMVDFVAAGTMTGYLCYDLTHYYLHHGSPQADSYMYVMKRYHNHHHFSHHEQGFGISSRLWDYVFGSHIRLKKLKKAIVW